MKKFFLGLIAFVSSLMLLSACGKYDTDSENASSEIYSVSDATENIISEDVTISNGSVAADFSLFGNWVLDGSVTDDFSGVVYTFNEDLTGHIYYNDDNQYDITYTYDEINGLLDIMQEGYAVNEFNYGLPDSERLVIGNMTFYRQ